MWNDHLKKIVSKKTEISELDSILGKKDEEEADSETIGKSNVLIAFISLYQFLITEKLYKHVYIKTNIIF